MAMGLASGGRRRGRGGSRRTPMAEINVTPLVDVMLVLLIIFMVTAPLLTSAVPIDLPDSRANPMDQENDQITISIMGDGRIYLDDQELSPGSLPDRLAALPVDASGKPPLVVLRADRALDYGRVMEVMGELNHAGFNSISLVTNGSVSAP
jgi:biopolymer transport protein TolR